MSVGVSHSVTGSMRYSWHVPDPASIKEVHKAIGWAEDVAKDLGISTNFDNWLMFRYDQERNEIEVYFDVDLGAMTNNERLQLLESKQRRANADAPA